jgi:hypothetical protein
MTHPSIAKAREVLARLDGCEERWARERVSGDPTEEAPDVRWRRLRQQSQPEPPQPRPEPKPEQPKSATMDEAASKPWNDWAVALIRAQIEEHEKILIDATAEFVAEYTTNRLKDLEAEVASLRADLHIMREIKNGEILDLPRLPRRGPGDAAY